ncbi:hypothetical protein GGR52DRAFT_533396 [Hypoxylon sp. FL1284]|nr:hypothetical protein GGR52DRAFT_533396 [Hypoxylon sp. FL1284]
MCTIYYVKYTCGCTDDEGKEVPCASLPSVLGDCERGLARETILSDGPCDKHA